MWQTAREGRGGCVTLGAMFAAARDARPGGDRACGGAARPARGGPSTGQAGRAGKGPGREGGLRWPGLAGGRRRPDRGHEPEGEEGAFLASEVGVEAPSGGRGAPAGAAWRARSGGGASPGGGGGATAAPPQAKFEKRTRFPPFFKPKNKTFSPLPPGSLPSLSRRGAFITPGLQGRAPVGPGQPRWRPRPPPRAAAAQPRAPARELGPSVWAGGGSSRQPGRAPGRHSAMLAGTRLPPPRAPACGLGPARSPARPSARGARGPCSASVCGARLAPAGAARLAAADSCPLRSAAALLPLLKRATPGGRLRPGQAPGVRAGLGPPRVQLTDAGTWWPPVRERL